MPAFHRYPLYRRGGAIRVPFTLCCRLRSFEKVPSSAMDEEFEEVTIFPAKHFVINQSKVETAIRSIRAELVERTRERFDSARIVLGEGLAPDDEVHVDDVAMYRLGGLETGDCRCRGRPNGSRRRSPTRRPIARRSSTLISLLL